MKLDATAITLTLTVTEARRLLAFTGGTCDQDVATALNRFKGYADLDSTCDLVGAIYEALRAHFEGDD